ncbi:hypothetical protein N1851_022580 [Merluccius polli]|uniref:Uncharacterized protein n=1 Tax=Merluccius polli TaxID=89951 RepID=A0AA47NYC9_MERPO|nr:hypothetical protein N1851_022580 [Merluccius polli]
MIWIRSVHLKPVQTRSLQARRILLLHLRANQIPSVRPRMTPLPPRRTTPSPPRKTTPFTAQKDDPFTAQKDDPFTAQKDDPFTAQKEDPFNDATDPFAAPVPSSPKDDPFDVLSSPLKEDPFGAPTTPPKEDPFAAPLQTTPPKDDPFDVLSSPLQDEPLLASITPPKEDPFATPTTPPKDDPSDPFSAPAGSPSTDAWEPPATSPSAASDPWGPAAAPEVQSTGGDPWGDGASAASPTSTADPFGDATKPDSDPWGAPAAAPPANPDDAWGSPAPPPDSAPSDDPFGDGASKASDPWGAPSNAPSNGTGGPQQQEEEEEEVRRRRKAAAFLGSAGAMLVDLDSLLSTPAAPPLPPPHTSTRLPLHTPPAGALNGPVGRTIPTAAGVPPLASSSPRLPGLFGSVLVTSCDPSRPTYGGVQLSSWGGGSQFHQPTPSVGTYHSGFTMPVLGAQPAPPYSGTGMVRSGGFIGGNPLTPHQGAPPFFSPRMAQPGSVGGSLQAGVAPLGGSIPPQGGGVQWGSGSGETTEINPFLI